MDKLKFRLDAPATALDRATGRMERLDRDTLLTVVEVHEEENTAVVRDIEGRHYLISQDVKASKCSQ